MSRKSSNFNLAAVIDHTFLKPAGDKRAIINLCREAKSLRFASVCVNPAEIRVATKLLQGSGVKVCTVIDFPLGQGTVESRCDAAVDALIKGADELDLVVNQRLLKYDAKSCLKDLSAFVRASRRIRRDAVLKLILECCNLTKAEIVRGCRLAKKAGFDFVKTSTGFGLSGATVEDVRLMRKTVGKKMGVKAAGGIRDRETALKMIVAGATRLGTSAGKKLL